MFLKVIFAWLLGTGLAEPMNETNDGREMYYLYVLNEKKEVFVFEHCYEEEIWNYIATGEFKYNEMLTKEELAKKEINERRK